VTIWAEDISLIQWQTTETFDFYLLFTVLFVGPYIFTLYMMFHLIFKTIMMTYATKTTLVVTRVQCISQGTYTLQRWLMILISFCSKFIGVVYQ